jgi:hypothetical protein
MRLDNDKMQKNYSYVLTAPAGKKFDPLFKPDLTPAEMLAMGVFEGKYLNDCRNEFPQEWYLHGKFTQTKHADASVNLFGIKSRLSLQEWRKRGWIPIAKGDHDPRGWFQWYARYWLGRRIPHIDEIQIKRWRAFVRHKAQVIIDSVNKKITTKKQILTQKHRLRQRQALLQWAYNPFVVKYT